MFETFRRCGSEGVAFQEIDTPFSPDRPILRRAAAEVQ